MFGKTRKTTESSETAIINYFSHLHVNGSNGKVVWKKIIYTC